MDRNIIYNKNSLIRTSLIHKCLSLEKTSTIRKKYMCFGTLAEIRTTSTWETLWNSNVFGNKISIIQCLSYTRKLKFNRYDVDYVGGNTELYTGLLKSVGMFLIRFASKHASSNPMKYRWRIVKKKEIVSAVKEGKKRKMTRLFFKFRRVHLIHNLEVARCHQNVMYK